MLFRYVPQRHACKSLVFVVLFLLLNAANHNVVLGFCFFGIRLIHDYYSIAQIVNFINCAGPVLIHQLRRSAVLHERILKYCDPLQCPT